MSLNSLSNVNSINHCQIKNQIAMMKNQKTCRALSWKAATFLPLLAFLLLTCCNPSHKILGTWKLVSYKYGEGKETAYPAELKAIKLITPTHFTWIHYQTKDNVVYDSAGGTYKFDGVNYTENVDYGGKGMVPYFGKSQFKIKIKGDQMNLSGTLTDGYKIEEVWKKM
jgi:hypothetical protein